MTYISNTPENSLARKNIWCYNKIKGRKWVLLSFRPPYHNHAYHNDPYKRINEQIIYLILIGLQVIEIFRTKQQQQQQPQSVCGQRSCKGPAKYSKKVCAFKCMNILCKIINYGSPYWETKPSNKKQKFFNKKIKEKKPEYLWSKVFFTAIKIRIIMLLLRMIIMLAVNDVTKALSLSHNGWKLEKGWYFCFG